MVFRGDSEGPAFSRWPLWLSPQRSTLAGGFSISCTFCLVAVVAGTLPTQALGLSFRTGVGGDQVSDCSGVLWYITQEDKICNSWQREGS